MKGHLRRRSERQPATVVVTGEVAHVTGVDPDELQLLLLASGLASTWDGTVSRWTVRTGDALRLAAALRSSGRPVRLASGGERP